MLNTSLNTRAFSVRRPSPWYLSLAAMGLVGWGAINHASLASAQEPTSFVIQDTQPPAANQPPTLPQTEVEATPSLSPTNVEGMMSRMK